MNPVLFLLRRVRNTLRLNFCYLKIIHFLHPGYRPKTIGYSKECKKRVASVESMAMKMTLKMKNRSQR